MSRLEELIEELCPNGVEMKQLNDVIISLKTGLNPRKNFVLNTEDAEHYYVTVREIVNGKVIFSDKTDRVNNDALKLINNRSNLEVGDVLFSGTGTVGRIAVIEQYFFNWNIKEGVYVIKPKQEIISSKYLAYILGSSSIIQDYSLKIVGSPVCSLPMAELKKLIIPIPPLPIQQEIVRILDNFTEITGKLTAELTGELTVRKKQYEYYRNQLLTFETEIEWKSLGSVCTLVTGATPSKSKSEYWENGTIPWMSSGEVNLKRVFSTGNKITQLGYDNASTTLVPMHSVVIALAGQGKTRGKVAITEIELCTNQSLCSIICGEEIHYKYLYYYLDHKYDELRAISNGNGTRGGLSLKILSPYKIPLPSLEEQQSIVDILDRFDNLYNAISTGIQVEIEARKKQYEYYRDKLLTFKMKK